MQDIPLITPEAFCEGDFERPETWVQASAGHMGYTFARRNAA